jgi:hypothetical protein
MTEKASEASANRELTDVYITNFLLPGGPQA